MMGTRVYRLPVMNLTAAIWNYALPADLSTWNGAPPDRAPDLVTICQLYYPRYGVGRWLHALSDSAVDTLLKSGFQELRCPKDTPVSGPWGVNLSTTWAVVPLVEVPQGSGRYYAGVMIDQAHCGFVNEYRIVLLSQLANMPSAAELPAAFAWALDLGPTYLRAELPAAFAWALDLGPTYLRAELPAAFALASELSGNTFGAELPAAFAWGADRPPTFDLVELPAAFAWGADRPPTFDLAELPAAFALASELSGSTFAAALPAAFQITRDQPPTYVHGDLPAAFQIASVISSGGGAVTPGVSCLSAATITLPFTQTDSIAASGQGWFKFTAGAGQYHVRLTATGGGGGGINVYTGSCAALSFVGHLGFAGDCVDFTPGSGTVVFINETGGLMGSASYTISVATGAC